MPHPRDLADTTWPEVGRAPLLLVPVGSLEQHGRHLPLDTDTTIATAVARGVAERLDRRGVAAWVCPPVAIGSSGEHQSFAGTVSIGTQTLRLVLVELVRSASTWAGRIVLVNAHGGNIAALTSAVNQLRRERHPVSWPTYRAQETTDLHAGRAETSLMLHLRPGAVRLDRAEAGDTRPLTEIMPAMRTGGVAAVSANGVLGDPTGASAAEGSRLLEAMVEQLTGAVLAPDHAAAT